MSAIDERTKWWGALTHGGLLIAPSRLAQHFPAPAPSLHFRVEERLRAALDRLTAGRKDAESEVLDVVLQDTLGLGRRDHFETGLWEKASQLGPEHGHRDAAGATTKPRRLWRGPHGVSLPVFFDDAQRIGVHRGRRSHARVVEWLRAKGQRIALLTNGRQWRVVYAGLNADAWAESDAARWFEEGGEGDALRAMRTLLGPDALIPRAEGATGRLLEAIEATRRGQSELSAALGENVRTAVERLITAHTEALTELTTRAQADGLRSVAPKDVYVAACRVVMRLVVLLFAEAREGLLPLDRETYRENYSLAGLRALLERAAGGAAKGRLRERISAWPRVLALFRLMHRGAHHPELPIPRYGGGLFAPGSAADRDPVARALHVFEIAAFAGDGRARVSDLDVFEMLRLLTQSRIKVSAGRGKKTVVAPVDFSDLSSEYIGILYEGLLDFELRRVTGDAPVVFVDIGDQPALPLDRLESMDSKAIKALVEKLGKPVKKSVASDDGDDEDDAETEADDAADELEGEGDADRAEDSGDGDTEVDEAEPDETLSDESDPATDHDRRGAAVQRARAWALRAVEEGSLLKTKGRASKREDALEARAAAAETMAKRIVARTVLPGEWYLVRFGGTRKGSGTYYTKPALAIPTVQRTLRPLCYAPPLGANGAPDRDAPAERWTPRRPEQLLALKLCDPACGSGSFLVASLRYLTEALEASLHYHGRIADNGANAVVRLADGDPALRLEDELLPCRPDDGEFGALLRARLRRHVVERCIHGVDLDPLAVELCRLALWVETLDRSLPFTFLDHRIKCGNALVGCWFDQVEDYPILAWEREGGDKGHSTSVTHAPEAWTEAIARRRAGVVKKDLLDALDVHAQLDFDAVGKKHRELHAALEASLNEMHALPITLVEQREQCYLSAVAPQAELLRLHFDTWCAVWFWPGSQIDLAPLASNLLSLNPAAQEVVQKLREQHRFFHWEIEYPDVFTPERRGFDAVIGNPPWENLQVNREEYFANLDPLMRGYDRDQKLEAQRGLFRDDASLEAAWLRYCADHKAIANFSRNAGHPWGDPADGGTEFKGSGKGARGTEATHRRWRQKRASRRALSDSIHPYRSQGGGRVFSYKLFTELGFALLAPEDARTGCRLGLIVPGSIYTDKFSRDLRSLLGERGSWEWVFGFENRRKIFDIHGSFKFAIVIASKSERLGVMKAAFMRRDVSDWAEAESFVTDYSAMQVKRFAPRSGALLEVSNQTDIALLEKIFGRGRLLGDLAASEGLGYSLEFMMNTDAKLFPPRGKWEAKGYEPDEYSRWLLAKWRPRTAGEAAPLETGRHELQAGVILSRDRQRWTTVEEIQDMALPLYQGVMVRLFDPRAAKHISGAGNRAKWEDLGPEDDYLQPQFLMGARTYAEAEGVKRGFKLGFRDIARSTDQRTFITSLLPDLPVGNKVPVLSAGSSRELVALLGSLGSFAFDWVTRRRLGGTSLNWFIVEELPAFRSTSERVPWIVLRLVALSPAFCSLALELGVGIENRSTPWARQVARAGAERVRLRSILDAVVFGAVGLNLADVRHILAGCDRPQGHAKQGADPRGFWRVDQDRHPELRHTVLSLVAYADLQSDIRAVNGDMTAGIEAFLARNDGEGWMLPETLRLADYDLGHDERAMVAQPVASVLGPRFYDWQLAADPAASWRECELHAENLRLVPAALRT